MQKEASSSLKIISKHAGKDGFFPLENLGISTFTSLISDREGFVFLKAHLERLLKGGDFLFPNAQWPQKEKEITEFLASEFVPSHYFRLELQEDHLFFKKKPHLPRAFSLKVSRAQSLKTSTLVPEFVKQPNYLVSELEIREAKKHNVDDIIFFTPQGYLCEASTSNIFVVMKNQKVLTPKLSSMVLQGVVREKLIEFFKRKKISLEERDITESELESSQEIWFTNAVQGLRLVTEYNGKLFCEEADFYQDVVKNFGRFGEKYNRYE